MNPYDAITEIEVAKAEVEWEYPISFAAAFDEGINALRKKIPYVPVHEEGKIFCSACGEELSEEYNFCPFCSQAIDKDKDEGEGI